MTHRFVWRIVALLVAVLCLPGAAVAKAGEVPLVEAVKNLDRAAVRALLDHGADVNMPAVDGATALHWAVYLDDQVLVWLLIDAGADVRVANRYGVQTLSLASLNGSAEVIEQLLSAGADPNTSLPGGETALMTAARTGTPAALRVLVAHGADVNARDAVHGQTALMWAAAEGHAEAIHLLAEVGGDIHARTASPARESLRRDLFLSPSPTGFTPLMFAVRAGHLDATRVLLDARADVNDTLSDGQSVLVVAAANANWELADYLLDRGADPNLAVAGWNALHQAVRTRRWACCRTPGPMPAGTVESIDVIEKIIAKGVDIDARMTRNGMKDGQWNRLNRLGATAFLLAAKNIDVEAMQLLAEAGADANIATAENTTPLMVAAGLDVFNPGEDAGTFLGQEEEALEAVKMCVELGNDVNAVNDLMETALHGAAFRGANIVVDYLVEHGAKLGAREANGWIPWGIANGFSYTAFYKAKKHTAELLARYMAERGMSTEGEAIPGAVCFECWQTRRDQARAAQDLDERMEADYAARYLREGK